MAELQQSIRRTASSVLFPARPRDSRQGQNLVSGAARMMLRTPVVLGPVLVPANPGWLVTDTDGTTYWLPDPADWDLVEEQLIQQPWLAVTVRADGALVGANGRIVAVLRCAPG